MTIIKDTHLTLIGIPSRVEANNSLNFFAITNIREKNCRVSVPVHIYNSLVKLFHDSQFLIFCASIMVNLVKGRHGAVKR